MSGLGWRQPFIERAWPEVRTGLASVGWATELAYPIAIVDSVLEHGADRLLAVTTSMHDLIVTPSPVGEPPMDAVVVRAPGSLRRHPTGTVLIEHLSVHGTDTSIERPAAEALPLFWRFIQTEFGIGPTTRPSP